MESTFESLKNGLTLSDYDDWLIFDARLSDLVRAGRARRIPALRVLHMPDEEWYEDRSSGDVYVYVRPDDKILPKWERIDVFAKPEETTTCRTGLDNIPLGTIDPTRIDSIKAILQILLRQEKIELVSPAPASVSFQPMGCRETVYRDYETGKTYRLVESMAGENARWEHVGNLNRTTIIQ
jgi:hypothetical protein